MKPTLSVIVPYFNAGAFVTQCCESILAECRISLELILVNDGSTDGSEFILSDIARRYPEQVKVLRQENAGPGSARNLGLDIAQGEYVSFIDADDYVGANYLEDRVNAAIQEDLDIAVAGHTRIHNSGLCEQKPPLCKLASQIVTGAEYMGRSMQSGGLPEMVFLSIYRRRFLEENALRFLSSRMHEDTDFVFRSFALAQRVGEVENTEYYYRHNPNSLTNSARKFIELAASLAACASLDSFLSTYTVDALARRVIKKKLAGMYLRVARESRDLKNKGEKDIIFDQFKRLRAGHFLWLNGARTTHRFRGLLLSFSPRAYVTLMRK